MAVRLNWTGAVAYLVVLVELVAGGLLTIRIRRRTGASEEEAFEAASTWYAYWPAMGVRRIASWVRGRRGCWR